MKNNIQEPKITIRETILRETKDETIIKEVLDCFEELIKSEEKNRHEYMYGTISEILDYAECDDEAIQNTVRSFIEWREYYNQKSKNETK